MAQWLDTFFSVFDHGILSFYHTLSGSANGILSPLTRLLTLLGEKGVLFLVAAVSLMCFRKTRRIGVCLFGAVCCGALITNIILKDLICRVRPLNVAGSDFAAWAKEIGAPAADSFSFPSGHATAAAAASLALILMCGKKWLAFGIPCVTLMCFSRNYLMAHYPSDVLFGVLIGACSAIIAWAITKGIFALLEKYPETAFCRFALEFDVRDLLRRKA